jgi:low temperature requirement protein LtrA
MNQTLRQPPKLHTELYQDEHDERKISWLELFYDLVYVATLIQLGDALSSDVSIGGFLRFVALFVPIWWSWTGITFYSNRFVADDLVHRVLIFTQILAIAALGFSVKGAFGDLYVQFTLSYVAVRFILVLLYLRAASSVPQAAELARRYAIGFAIAAFVWLIAAFVPSPYYLLFWLFGMLVDFAVPLGKRSRALSALLRIDVPHMIERYGIFVIIVLGESFVKVVSGLSGTQIDVGLVVFGLLAMTVVSGLWWLYFDDISGVSLQPYVASAYIWIYSHLPIAIGITAFGVAASKLILSIGSEPVADKYRWLTATALVFYLLFVALVDWVTVSQSGRSNRTRSIVRLAAALLVVLFTGMTGGATSIQYTAGIAVIFAGQIGIDLLLSRVQEKSAE